MASDEKGGIVVELVGWTADQLVETEYSGDCEFSGAVQERAKVAALPFVGFFADESYEFNSLHCKDGEQ